MRNTFLDVTSIPLAGEFYRRHRRVRSAPDVLCFTGGALPTLVSDSKPPDLGTRDNAISTLQAVNASLDQMIHETQRINFTCLKLLDLSSGYRRRRLTSRTRSFFLALQKAYRLDYTTLVLKMLYGVLRISDERVRRFFSELRRRDVGCNEFHLQFVLDAHAPCGVKHYLVFVPRDRGCVRCLTMSGLPASLTAAEATTLSHTRNVICLKKTGRRYQLCTVEQGLDSISIDAENVIRI